MEDPSSAVRMTRGPAMTDVARLAGVSHQTVSRVLNDHPNVREQTRLRVRAAIKELGYRPNNAARTLVTGESKLIGVVAQNSILFGPSSLLAAFELAAAAQGFVVSVRRVRVLDRSSITAAVEHHRDQRAAGIVVIAPTTAADEALAEVPADVPLVAVDGDPHRRATLVTVDQEAGAHMATQYLLDAGHETVWHVSGPSEWFDAAARRRGWQRTLERAGAEVPPVLPADWSAAAGYGAGRVLARDPGVSAVFAANDHLALGILRAMAEHGRDVPGQVSVVGFDDVPEAAYFIPPLTTVRADFDKVASETLSVLLAEISGEQDAPARRTITPTLVERDSVAPAHD